MSVSAYVRHSDDSSAEPSKLVLRFFLPFFITFESLVDVVSASRYQPVVKNSSTGVDIEVKKKSLLPSRVSIVVRVRGNEREEERKREKCMRIKAGYHCSCGGQKDA